MTFEFDDEETRILLSAVQQNLNLSRRSFGERLPELMEKHPQDWIEKAKRAKEAFDRLEGIAAKLKGER